MSNHHMTSMQRVLTTLSGQEPDRVPFFLLLSMHGAKELGLSIRDYFSKPEHVVEGQLKLREKYHDDCIYSFFYAPIEIEAWGGEVIYFDDGPANSGRPFIEDVKQIKDMKVPVISDTACLARVLEATKMLKASVEDEAPIIGVALSPFSLPVMQMGFPSYIRLMYENRPMFDKLMQVNEEFCVAWSNAQLEAGATAICFFDPVSSTTITTRELYLDTGFKVAQRTIGRINGPVATHMASGRCLPIVDDIIKTGSAIIGTSVMEDLRQMKQACRGELTLLGNMNGIEMRNWSAEQAEAVVKEAINKAASGGRFILSDNHGEIPWQVPDEVLLNISNAVHRWGTYPLQPGLT